MAVYEKLIAAGWQHPETLTWLSDPETFYFGAKDAILSGLTLGGEPMIEIGLDPNKQFATYLEVGVAEPAPLLSRHHRRHQCAVALFTGWHEKRAEGFDANSRVTPERAPRQPKTSSTAPCVVEPGVPSPPRLRTLVGRNAAVSCCGPPLHVNFSVRRCPQFPFESVRGVPGESSGVVRRCGGRSDRSLHLDQSQTFRCGQHPRRKMHHDRGVRPAWKQAAAWRSKIPGLIRIPIR